MKLITQELQAKLLANGRASQEAAINGQEIDLKPVVKLFTPDAQCTWLLTELDPVDPDRAFGLCDLGLGCPELGYVSIQEVQSVRGRFGLPVERDMHFDANRTLAYSGDVGRSFRLMAVQDSG